jgi:hypothetical protein
MRIIIIHMLVQKERAGQFIRDAHDRTHRHHKIRWAKWWEKAPV